MEIQFGHVVIFVVELIFSATVFYHYGWADGYIKGRNFK